MRGDGTLYQRGSTWWLSYYRDGHRYQVSLRTDDEDQAEGRRRRVMRQVERGQLRPLEERRVTVGELLDDLLVHLRLRGRASADKAESHLQAVRAALGSLRAEALHTAAVERYQAQRRRQGRAAATVNRECELLRQAFRLAALRAPAKVERVPLIPLLPVDNARQGFLSPAQVTRILAAVGDQDLRDYLEWLAWTGQRPGEARQITWRMLDLEAGTAALAPAITKTRRGRTVPLVGPLLEIVRRRLGRRRLACELVFHRAGAPVLSYRKAWAAACRAAGLRAGRGAGGMTPYDLRRSALRNLIRAGVDTNVAMAISGHRTRATFDRYNITSVADIRAAIERTAAFVRGGRPE